MKRIKKQLYIVIIFVLYQDLINRYLFSSEYTQLVADFMLLSITIEYFKHIKSSSRRLSLGTWLPYIYVSIFVIGVASALAQNVSLVSILWGVRCAGRFSLLFVLVLDVFTMKDVNHMKKWLYNSYFICLFFCFVQFISGQVGDFMGGIFSGNGKLASFTIIIMIISSIDYFRKNIAPKKYAIIVVGFFIIAMWAEIKLLYFVLPLCFYACFVLYKRFSVVHVLILIVSFVGLVPAMQTIMSTYYSEDYVEAVFEEKFIEKQITNAYGFKKGGFNRSTAIALTSEKIISGKTQFLVGYGIGSGTISKSFSGVLFDKYKHTSYFNFATSYVLVELGWVGFVLFAWCIYLLAYRFWRCYWHARDGEIKMWAICGLISASATYILSWYNALPYVDYYMYYLFWALCFVAIRERKRRISYERKFNL